MNYFTLFLIVIAIVIVYLIVFGNHDAYIKSNIDNRYYIIRRGSQSDDFLVESANILALVNKDIEKLIQHLQEKYPDYKDLTHSQHFYIKFLVDNYSYKILSEGNIDKRYTTYTIDKQEIKVCLRTRDSYDKPYDINLLMYVILHELAHLCNYDHNSKPIIGHGIEFLKIFKFLIDEAIEIRVYKYVDYQKKPVNYCNLELNSQITSEH
jgi:hypothetical protein